MLAKMLTVQLQSEYGDAPDRSGAVCPTVEDKTWLDLQRDLGALGLRLPPDAWQGDRQRYPEEAGDPVAVYLDVDEVPAEVKPWLAKLLRVWVQSKYARQSDPLVFAAPSPEQKVETGHQLRDERAFGLQVARMLRGLGEDPDPVADEAERSLVGGRWKVDFLKQPLSFDWVECCLQQLLATRANAIASLACFGSCLAPLGAWAGQHYKFQTEAFELWKARCRAIPDRQELQTALDAWYPYVVDIFGAESSANEERYCALGIKTAQNAHIRQIFVDFIAQDLADLGLRAPNLHQGARARYSPFVRPEKAASSAANTL